MLLYELKALQGRVQLKQVLSKCLKVWILFLLIVKLQSSYHFILSNSYFH